MFQMIYCKLFIILIFSMLYYIVYTIIILYSKYTIILYIYYTLRRVMLLKCHTQPVPVHELFALGS